MRPVTMGAVLALATILLFSQSLLAADPPDLVLELGQSADGDIAFPGEEDQIRFPAVEGTKITMKLKVAKGSPLAADLAILDPSGQEVPIVAPAKLKITGKGAAISKFVTNGTGTWTLVVRGTDATRGGYSLKTKGSPPKKLPKEAGTIGTAGETKTLTFHALPGTLLIAALKGKKGAMPRFTRLLDPEGTDLGIGEAFRATKGSKDTIKKLPLPDVGERMEYSLEYGVEGDAVGDYKLSVKLKAPKPEKTTHDFRGGSGGAPGGTIESLRVWSPEFRPEVGDEVLLVAVGRFDDGRERDLTLSSVFASSHAGVATVSNAEGTRGLLDAVGAGGSVLTCASGTMVSRGALLLVGGETVTGVTVGPGTLMLADGETAGLTARLDLAGGGSVDGTRVVTWASDRESTATVDEEGAVTGVAAGSADLTAEFDGTTSTQVATTVQPARLLAIRLSPRTATVAVGGTAQFSATGVYSDGSTRTITGDATWESDWATGAAVSDTAPTKGLAEGQTKGVAGVRARFDGVVSGAALVFTGGVQTTSVTVSPASADAPLGGTAAYTATANFDDGSSRDVTAAAAWSTEDGTVATARADFEDAGIVDARMESDDPVNVNAALGVSFGTGTVRVVAPAVESLRVIPEDPGLAANETIGLRAIATLTDGTTRDDTSTATWASENESAATVVGGRVTAKADGATGITATSGGVTSAPSIVKVGDLDLVSVAVGSPTEGPLGTPQELTAELTFDKGGKVDATARARWSSASPADLPVGEGTADGGRVVPRAEGATNVFAAFAGFATDPFSFTGLAADDVDLEIFPQAPAAPLGLTFPLGAMVASTDGRVRDGASEVDWSSRSPGTADVDGSGRVTTNAQGTATLDATLDGLSDSTPFSVQAPILLSLEVTPASPILAEGATLQMTATGTWTDGSETNETSNSTWFVTNEPVASVSGTGLVTAKADGVTSVIAFQGAVESPPATLEVEKAPVVTSLSGTTVLLPGASTTGLKINGANFLDGSTVSFTPDSITIDDLTVNSDSLITVDITVGLGATPGPRTVTVALPGAKSHITGSLSSAFHVKGTAPLLMSVSPTTADRGVATELTLTGDNFEAGHMSVDLDRTDVSVDSFTVDSPTSMRVTVRPDGDAVFGDVDISVTHDVNGASGTKTFAVVQAAPTVTSVSPDFGGQGEKDYAVTISGTNFTTGDEVSFSGTGVVVQSVTVDSSTEISITIDINASATKSLRNLTVTHSAAAGGKSGTLADAFEIQAPLPHLTSVSPGNVDLGTTKTVTLIGTDLNDGTITISPSSGLTISSVNIGKTSATFSLTVSAGATIGRRDVTLTRSDGQGDTVVDGLKIGPPDPTVTQVTPDRILPGSVHTTFTIDGTNFESGNTSVSFSGSGITVHTSTLSVTGTTKIDFEASLAPNATVGLRDLTVTVTGKGEVTEQDAIVVVPAAPTVASFSVATLSQGVSGVSVTVEGTNFRSGDTLAAGGSGVTFGSVTVESATEITATASVSGGATKSLRDLTVTHDSDLGGGAGTLADAFEVIGAVPGISTVSPSSLGATGSGGRTRRFLVVLTGSDIMSGATLSASKSGGSGLSVVSGSVTVESKTTLTAMLEVTGTATAGSWTLTLKNPGSSTTATKTISVVSSSTLNVNSVVPATGSTFGGERVTIYGSGFATGAVVDFGSVRGYGTQVIDANTLVVTVPQPTSASSTAATTVDVKVTNPSGSPSSDTLTKGYAYAKDGTVLRVESSVPVQGEDKDPNDPSKGQVASVVKNLRVCVLVMSEPVDSSTVTTSNLNWFEAGASQVSGFSVGLGPENRIVVLKRGSGDLSTGKEYVMNIDDKVHDLSGDKLIPVRLFYSLGRDQFSWTTLTTSDSTAPTVTLASSDGKTSGITTTATFTAEFSEEVDPTTITSSNITLKQGSTTVSAHLSLSPDLKTVTVTPETELGPGGTSYTLAVSTSVTDLSGNALSSSASQGFTTGSSTDSTAPVIDAIVIEELPSDLDGSGKYKTSSSSSADYDVYLPRFGWEVTVRFHDDGGAGIDEASLTVTSSVAVGSTSSGSDLSGNFTGTATEASWRIPSTSKVTAGSNVTFTAKIKDTAGNESSGKTITVDVVDIDSTSSEGGDLDAFDSRRTWVLRFDQDVYTVSIGFSDPSVTVTTSSSSTDGVPDFRQTLEIVGMQSDMSATGAKTATNGSAVGTNAIVEKLVREALRERLRERYSIMADGTRTEDSVNVEFLLPGEQGSLSSLPTWSTSTSFKSSKAFSEMGIGGDLAPNSSPTGTFTTLGVAWYDSRNLDEEADINEGSASGNEGIHTINIVKSGINIDGSSGRTLFRQTFDPFIAGRSGTPIGKDGNDATVLSDTFDRTSAGNTSAQNARYDVIMDAIDALALSFSSITAHEMGHSHGLVPDGAPPGGLFGNADGTNTFTEGGNTSHHLDFLGNDIMAPASSNVNRMETGTDFQRFSPYDINYLRNRQVYDDAK